MNITRTNRILIALSASLFSFFNIMNFSQMNVLGVYLANDLHFNAASIGFLASWDLLGNVVGVIPVGMLLDRYSVRHVDITIFSMAIVATIVLSYSSSLPMMCLLRFIQGFANAASLLTLMRIGTSLIPGHINKTIGMMIFIALSGGIVGNIVFSAMAETWGWRTAILGIATIGILCLIVMTCFFRPENQAIKSQHRKNSFSKYVIIAGILIGVMSAPLFVLASLFGNRYLINHFDLTINQAAATSSLIFVGIIIGSPLIGHLADTISSKKIIIISFIMLIVLTLALVLNIKIPYLVLSLLFIGLGLCTCTQNLIYPIICHYHPDARSGSTGVASLVSNGIGALTQMTVGLILQYISAQGTAVFVMMMILYVIGLLLTLCFLEFDYSAKSTM